MALLGRGRFLAATDRVAEQSHQAIALGEQVAKALLELLLLGLGLRTLVLLHLELLVGAAQAPVDVGAAVTDRGEAVLGARDVCQDLDERLVLGVPGCLQTPQRFAGVRGGGLGLAHRLAFLGEGRLDRGQLVAELRRLFLGGPQLCLELVPLPTASLSQLGQRGALAALVGDLALEFLDRGTQAEERFVALREDPLALGQVEPALLEAGFTFGESRLGRHCLVAEGLEPRAAAFEVAQQLRPLLARERELEDALLFAEAFELGRLSGLTFDRRDLSPDLTEHVLHAQQVLIRGLELALGLTPARLVLADAGRFLDERATFLGLSGHDLGDSPLLDDRVALRADPGVAEEVEDVAQAARRLVQQVLALAALCRGGARSGSPSRPRTRAARYRRRCRTSGSLRPDRRARGHRSRRR